LGLKINESVRLVTWRHGRRTSQRIGFLLFLAGHSEKDKNRIQLREQIKSQKEEGYNQTIQLRASQINKHSIRKNMWKIVECPKENASSQNQAT